jgi:hypothetical protein
MPRNQQLCRLRSTDGASFRTHHVGGGCVEDFRPFLLECPAYQHLRTKYPGGSGAVAADNTTQSVHSRLLAIVDCDQQDKLAHVDYTMTAFRKKCLSLPHGSHIAVNCIQQVVEEDV